ALARPIVAAEDFVRLRTALPLLAAHSVAHVPIDPGNEAARERDAEMLLREVRIAQDAGHLAVDVENRRRRILEQAARRHVRLAHLHEELAHVLRTGAGGRLVRHAGHPLYG